LPEFADAGALPTAHGGQNSFRRDRVSLVILDRPAAYLGTVELEGVKPERFGRSEAVGAWRRAVQPLAQKFQDARRPGSGAVATRAAGCPKGPPLLRPSVEVLGSERVDTAGGEAELFGGLSGVEGLLTECVEHLADERGGVTMEGLLVLFKDTQNNRAPWPHPQSFRRASLRSPSSKTEGAAKGIPVLLAPRQPI
jgi:hypothetical protein